METKWLWTLNYSVISGSFPLLPGYSPATLTGRQSRKAEHMQPPGDNNLDWLPVPAQNIVSFRFTEIEIKLIRG
jgi:hypothetical protein